MKNFLILLLSVTTFCAYSQNVTIPKEVASWYLEQAALVPILVDNSKIKEQMIDNLNQRMKINQAIIATYEQDNQYYREIIAVKNSQIDVRDKQLDLAKKEVKKQRTQKFIAIGAGTGAIVGSVVGQPLLGAVIGGGVGFVAGVVKKK